MREFTSKYLEDFLVRFTQNSVGIDGCICTVKEVESILLKDHILKGISKKDFHLINNHKDAMSYALTLASSDENLTIEELESFHYLLLDRLDPNRGNFKNKENSVSDSFKTGSVEYTPTLMFQWLSNLHFQVKDSRSDEERIKHILRKHIEFCRVHPFNVGNGVTARLLLNYSLLKNDFLPIVIKIEDKEAYFEILEKGDIEKFCALVKTLMEEEELKINGKKKKGKSLKDSARVVEFDNWFK